jgi:hypothetical protein
MNKVILLGILGILLISITFAQEEQEEPIYNLGTMQADKTLFIEPGGTGVAKLYFFNIHGNRVTHVKLYVTSAPPGWEIRIEPELKTRQFEVSGIIVNSTENLYIEPSKPVPEVPESVPEGVEYITMGGVEGYVPAKVARIIITVPEDEPLGKTYKISIEAIANWFGQAGTVTFSQARSFSYSITTVSHVYTEKLVEKSEKVEESEIPWTYMVIGVLILICILQAVLYVRRKR